MEEIIVDDIGSQIAIGMTVYDDNGDKIGTVYQYDRTRGWLQTGKGGLFPRDRYIPFSAIDRVDSSGIYLTVTTDYVNVTYDKPPLIEVDVVAGPRGTSAVATVPSGYDGSRVALDGLTISQIIARLENGLKVYDSSGEQLGRVYRYVAGSTCILVEKGAFSSDLYVPVTAVDRLDGEGVHLRVSKDTLRDAFAARPADVPLYVVAGPAGAVVVPSGYHGNRIVVDSTTIGLAMELMWRGPTTYDSDGQEVGRVHEYDPDGGWIVVEKGSLSPTDLFIPVTVVEYLDTDGVHLRVTRDVLTDAFAVRPANVRWFATVD